jgi:MFS family permease
MSAGAEAVKTKNEVPWGRLTPLYLAIFASGTSQNLIVPFVVEMCATRFKVAPGDVGVASGVLVGGFMLSSSLSSLGLGHISDRLGRRPLILLGLLASGLSTLLFGISETFAVALLARIGGGLFNGNIGILRAAISDVVTSYAPPVRVRAFGLMGGAFAGSRAIGSALAGVTTGALLKFWPFTTNDYLLPCILGLFVNLAALIAVQWKFRESNPYARKETTSEDVTDEVKRGLVNDAGGHTAEDNAGGPELDGSDDDCDDGAGGATTIDVLRRPSGAAEGVALEDDSSDSADDLDVTGVKKANTGVEQLPILQSLRVGLLVIWRDPLLLRVVLTFTLHSFLNGGLLFALILLYSLSIEDGGLGFSPQENGGTMFLFGGIAVVYQLFVFKWVVKRMSVTRVYQMGTGLLMVGTLTVPTPLLFSDSRPATWVVIALLCVVLGVGFMSGLPVLSTMLANSSDPQRYGLIQGLAASGANLTRALGPIILGMLVSAFFAFRAPWLITILLSLGYIVCFMTVTRIRNRADWISRVEGLTDVHGEGTEAVALLEVDDADSSDVSDASSDDEEPCR